jgi:DNA-binding NarL/FixJ family response regulator
MLNDVDGVSVVGEAETPLDAIEGILARRPNCVVLDFQLLGGTGVEVLRKVHPAAPEIEFIVLTNHPNAQYRRICMEAGATFFFDKSTEFGKIKDVIAGRPA